MELYCLRHGLAVDQDTEGIHKDAERPLTAEGKRKMRAVAKGMRAMGLEFDVILSSPSVRAWQTAEIVAVAMDARDRLILEEGLAPEGSPKQVVESLNNLDPRPEQVLVVGHEPCLSELVSLLVAGNAALEIVLKKGGLCKLSAESFKPARCAALEWLLTPRQMARMA
jgi:phosphohistidine phosphatase